MTETIKDDFKSDHTSQLGGSWHACADATAFGRITYDQKPYYVLAFGNGSIALMRDNMVLVECTLDLPSSPCMLSIEQGDAGTTVRIDGVAVMTYGDAGEMGIDDE